jgi:hypothetical protein
MNSTATAIYGPAAKFEVAHSFIQSFFVVLCCSGSNPFIHSCVLMTSVVASSSEPGSPLSQTSKAGRWGTWMSEYSRRGSMLSINPSETRRHTRLRVHAAHSP